VVDLGVAKSGRPRKPTSKLKAQGTYRADRHARKEPHAAGDPYEIGEMKGHARQLWDRVVPELVRMKVATAVDSAQLFAMCHWWREYRELQTLNSMDKYNRMIAMATAYKQFSAIASRFGLTPVDRASLEIEKSTADNPFLALMRG
jgi:phage terminase small subunit